MDSKPEVKWPRLRDLPADQRTAFNRWLLGQTCPWLEGIPESEQDGYFPGDYERWHHSWLRKQAKR